MNSPATAIPLTGNLAPCWDLSEFQGLDMTRDTLKSSSTPITTYTDAGHNLQNMCVNFYHESQLMPAFMSTVKQHFNFVTNLVTAINLLEPGCYLPWHIDGYDRFRQVFDITDSNRIYRALVMVQDSQPGQYVHIDRAVYHEWCAGDWFAWTGCTWHATYNLSTQDRYIIQLTGMIP